MVAYNHDIKFIPEIESLKRVDSSFSGVITVQKNSLTDLSEDLNHKMVFYNKFYRIL